jgi:hypothetical protein
VDVDEELIKDVKKEGKEFFPSFHEFKKTRKKKDVF